MLTLKRAILFSLFLTPVFLLTAQSTWHWGLKTQMGLSGWPRTVEDSGILDATTSSSYAYTAKERLQPAFGGGLWLAVVPHRHWRFQLGLGYRLAKMLATGAYEQTGGLNLKQFIETGWRSQYFQLPFQVQYTWSGNEDVQPYLGLGAQATYLWKHHHIYRGRVASSPTGASTEGFPFDFGAGVPLDNGDLERARLRMALTGEIGLRINQFTLALGTTQFLQKRRKGPPAYSQHVEIIDNGDGSYTPQGTSVRYAGTVDIRFYYAFR